MHLKKCSLTLRISFARKIFVEEAALKRRNCMGFFPRQCVRKLICVGFLLWGLNCIRARADVSLLLEEPFGQFGDMNPTGHAAIYLNHVCAASPTELRPCTPGEAGVVISRYHRIGGYDWLAIPLIPYLYAVDDPRDVPEFIDAKLEMQLRDQYRRKHLLDLVPDDPKREIPKGDWIQLVGASYDRKIYGYRIETSEEQDHALIEALNQRSNKSHFNLFFNNCANFSQKILNFYYPHAVRRNYIADAGLMTPKQAAKSLVHYSKRHRDLEFSTFVIPQVSGTIHHSDPVDGVVESLVKSKKYLVPIAALHPFVAGGLALVYLGDGRFHLDKNAPVFDPVREFQTGDMAENRALTLPESGNPTEQASPGNGVAHAAHNP